MALMVDVEPFITCATVDSSHTLEAHKVQPAEPPEERCALGMTYAQMHVVPRVGQVFHDRVAEESRPAECRYRFERHRLESGFLFRKRRKGGPGGLRPRGT